MFSLHPHGMATWTERLGRMGLAARGFVYVMVGFLAVKTALGLGGKATDQHGAMEAMGRLPFGDVVLWIVALGLLAYVAWRFAQAFGNSDHNGRDAQGMGKRAAALGSGLAYLGVSTGALALAAGDPKWRLGMIGRGDAKGAGTGGAGSDAMAQDWTAWLMGQPFGRWLVGIAAGVVAGIAVFQFYQAITCKFAEQLKGPGGGGMTPGQEKWSRRAGRLGHAARGVALGLISGFLFQAAIRSDAGEAGGISAAFRALENQPQGMWLLAAVGAGFALFGVYSLVEARYRRIGR